MSDDPRVMAPWSDEQVALLVRWQASQWVHPFTCANRGDGKHHDDGRDLGCLVPTNDGWVCPDCDYTQPWALSMMVDAEAVAVLERGPFSARVGGEE